MTAYYLCQECLYDRILTRLRRVTPRDRLRCPVDSEHDPRLHAPIIVMRGDKQRAILSYSKDSPASQRTGLAELLSKVEAAIPEVSEALDATESFIQAEWRKRQALDRLPHGWRVGQK